MTLPKRGDKALRPYVLPVEDNRNVVTCMAYADGYVMARRPEHVPFAVTLAEWQRYRALWLERKP